MKTETGAHMIADDTGLGFKKGGSKSYARSSGQAEGSRSWVPLALGSAILAYIVLPKAVRKTVVVAALPVAVPWLRRFFR